MIQYPLNSRVDPLVHLISKSRDFKSQIWGNPCLFNNYVRVGKSQKPPTYTAPGAPAEFVGAVDTSEPGIFSVGAVISGDTSSPGMVKYGLRA